jgi:hypothetical protein
VQPPVLSFGDGAHRCPGAFIAIQESDVFLHRLLRLSLRLPRPPQLSFNETLNSYELRDFVIEVEAAAGASQPGRTEASSSLGGRAPSGRGFEAVDA